MVLTGKLYATGKALFFHVRSKAVRLKVPILETFILIPGRTSKQGCGISEGKFEDGYQHEITTLQVSPPDMKRLGLANGDRVRITTESGRQIDVAVTAATGDELPAGMLFIAYGDMSSKLMGGDKAIYELESGGTPAQTSAIAEALDVSAPSVSGMLKRLAETGLTEHVPYRGVMLTASGRRTALKICDLFFDLADLLQGHDDRS